MIVDARRLAAVDMHGLHGGSRRRRVIRAEFFLGALGCTALGLYTCVASQGWGRALGIWLIGIALNYVPLALAARDLSRPGALEDELKGLDLAREGRRMGLAQAWLLVPLAVASASLANRSRRRHDQ